MSGRVQKATLRCTRCGAEFGCDPAGECWCKDQSFRLPMPKAGAESCLCPACLRARAAEESPPHPVNGEDSFSSPPPLRGRVREGGRS